MADYGNPGPSYPSTAAMVDKFHHGTEVKHKPAETLEELEAKFMSQALQYHVHQRVNNHATQLGHLALRIIAKRATR